MNRWIGWTAAMALLVLAVVLGPKPAQAACQIFYLTTESSGGDLEEMENYGCSGAVPGGMFCKAYSHTACSSECVYMQCFGSTGTITCKTWFCIYVEQGGGLGCYDEPAVRNDSCWSSGGTRVTVGCPPQECFVCPSYAVEEIEDKMEADETGWSGSSSGGTVSWLVEFDCDCDNERCIKTIYVDVDLLH